MKSLRLNTINNNKNFVVITSDLIKINNYR